MVCTKVCLGSGALVLALAFSTAASAQQVISVQPMTASIPTTSMVSSDSYYCAKCGRYHSRSGGESSTQTGQSTGIMQTSGVMRAPGSMLRAAAGGTRNVLAALNAQRARQGVGSLASDGQLQAVAEQRAQLMASTRMKSHPPGSYSPGRYEGVGWSSSYSPSGVSACFTSDPSMRVAGAAMATGSDGVYFCVVYR